VAIQGPAESAHELYRLASPQYVGIRYWLDTENGTRVTAASARPATRYVLHLQCNTEGFLTVFDADRRELTPRSYPPYPGLLLRAGQQFDVPGTLKLAPEGVAGVVFLFARSQTEQVDGADQAVTKLARLRPYLMTEIVSEGVQLGTYVVHPRGAQSAGTIRLVR
jgi:hypothetical protein